MRRMFEYGGIAASVMLIAFGVGALVIGFQGRSEVRDSIARENIVAPADDPAAKELGIAGKEIKTGDDAKAFASMMRVHTLEATEGLTYAQMGRFVAKEDAPAAVKDKLGGTNVEEWALVDEASGRPVDNPRRSIWVTETALTTALNTSFFAERVAYFSMVMGVALLLTGIGFFVLTLGGALQRAKAEAPATTATPVRARTPVSTH